MSISSPATSEIPGARLAWVGAPLRGGAKAFAAVSFEDSDDFLLSPAPFDFKLFVIRSAQRGVAGLDLIRLVRRRTAAGIVALCDHLADEFVPYLGAGADMVLGSDASPEHLRAAILAVERRVLLSHKAISAPWRLTESEATLETPEGKKIPLSESDLAILQCFAANGGKVDRQALIERLWGEDAGGTDNALHATVYRLRKKIEQAGQTQAPLYVVPKVGYEFRAPLAAESGVQPGLPANGSNMSRRRR